LSYTTFAYRDLKVANARLRSTDTLVVTVTVANTGSRAGTDVAQLYVHDDVGSVTRPLRQLKGFQRVELAAGATKTVEFRIPVQQLGLWNQAMRYVVEPGTFHVYAGSNSSAELVGTFEVVGGR
jgi:beta-glucosidase